LDKSITLPAVENRHTGENLAKSLFDNLETFSISNKIGYSMLNGASNDMTAVDELYQLLVSKFGTDIHLVPLR